MPYRDGVISASWIASDNQLAAAVATWTDAIGLDTEFIRTDTFYPVPGLYQIASGATVFLLDPLLIDDWRPFVDFLQDAQTVIVMHACQEDLELLHHHIGASVNNLFDTQFANAYVCSDFSLSYANLVQRLLNVELDQHETRSNWLRRPLSEDQVRYAMEDVIYLVPMYEQLKGELEALDRSLWFSQDMAQRAVYADPRPEHYYRNIKKAWRLSPSELAALKSLTEWRERTARDLDVPRNRVVWDDHLVTFARFEELSQDDVHEILPRGVARRHAPDLVEQHAHGRAQDNPPMLDKPLTTSQGAVLKLLREVARDKASEIGMAQELLARKRDLDSCIRSFMEHGRLSELYSGWRSEFVGAEFERILERLTR